MVEFRMPSLGADMEAGTVVEWRVKPGDRVQRGDIVAAVDTEKAVIDVEVFEDGVVDRILVEAGQQVPVGTPLAVLTADGPPPGSPAPAVPAGVVPAAPPPSVPPPVSVSGTVAPAPPEALPAASPLVRHLAEDLRVDLGGVKGGGPGGHITRADVLRAATPPPVPRLLVSPRARREAAALGVDLSVVQGTGPGGAVTGDDVRRAAATPREPAPARPTPERPAPKRAAPPARAAEDRQASARAAIARLMARSKREIPHFYLRQDVDLGRALDWLEGENLRRPVKQRVLPIAVLLRATALAAREVPGVNGFWRDGAFVPAEQVNLGLAIVLRGGGLVTPAIVGAADLVLADLAAAFGDLVTRARRGGLRGSEMTAGTLTVTNLGDQGVQEVYGVIHPPQVALVGFGRISERPWAHDGMVGARPVVTVTLSADHRAIDGHLGGLFLSALDHHLQEPETL